MKKTTIRYLVALGVMLGAIMFYGCKKTVPATETLCGCQAQETPEVYKDVTVFYDGYVDKSHQFRMGSFYYAVCDSSKLIGMKLVYSNTQNPPIRYTISFKQKVPCIDPLPGIPLVVHYQINLTDIKLTQP